MADLVRWEPSNVRSAFDSLFDDFFAVPAVAPIFRFGSLNRAPSLGPVGTIPIDVVENEGHFVVKANVPGIKKEDIEVEVTAQAVTIKGKYSEESENNNKGYMVRERYSGSFSRVIPVGKNVATDKIEARYENGVLELKLPKIAPEQPKSRKLEIQ